MTIVFVSPKQRQKMFFLGITVLFLLVLLVIGALVFFAKPTPPPPSQVFIKPKIDINFNVLDLQQVQEGLLMGKVQKEFTYKAETDKGVQKSGSIFAASMDDAKKTIEDSGLVSVSLEEVSIGRENPFTPYYGAAGSTIKTKK